ncbi:iron uptake porin [Nostoc sp. CMAA1605]|uniref:iron uptake porin n=1 Tax=Nostoc sp. CMAA1605 TaxID=2055159 RepID=UPI001F2B390A|nr:iron uptake porin [Nostoc sp. CMAA1605]MCF4967251.1 hypothetical protein [Nostoc sp. CMAA1605]
MTKLFWNAVKASPAILAATFLAANAAWAEEANQNFTSVAQLTQASQDMGQVTSVSQFSDVQPTDWAFQALQSLVERYGCIAGYPNLTYRGNRSLTRYEFAAGLNACLDRVNELIATATADLVTKEDLATLQRLQEEFSAELATLRGRVDALEARTAELEANQFSTTTKLSGEVIFAGSQVFGEDRADTDNNPNNNADLQSNTTFSNRVRLTLNTSFTGKDRLQTRLNAGNIVSNTGVTGTNMTRLGFDVSDTSNNVAVDKLNYSFSLSEAISVKIDAVGAELNENVNVFNPDFASSGRGALSRYGRFSPIYRQGQGGAGLTVNFNAGGPLSLSAAYLAPRSNEPADRNGVFDGSSTIFGQIGFKPNPAFNIGFAYAHSYVNNAGGNVNIFGSTGSTLANRPFGGGIATSSNNYGIQATFQPSSKLTIGAWGGYTVATAESGANRGRNAEAYYWAGSLAVKDFGREGNVLGLIFGQSPRLTDNEGGAEDPDTSYHLEGLYKIQLTDNIQITPGLMVIFNPEHNDNNDSIYVGTIRTTFSF